MNKGKGQRHETLVLAVALGVLLVTVGLFFLRSQPRSAASPAPAAAEQPKAPVAPKPQGEKSPVGRDPFTDQFAASQASVVVASAPPPTPATGTRPQPQAQAETRVELSLVGLMSGTPRVAVIHGGKRKYLVKVGERVRGYTVTSISADRVVLSKGTERVTLLLRPQANNQE